MIYLIGGPPKCGKTTGAKKLAKHYQIPWISVDMLQNIVWVYTPEDKRSALFPHKCLRRGSNDEFYSKYSPKEIVKNYIIQGKTSYDAIDMMIETYLASKEDCIIEGYQVTPELVKNISTKLGKENTRAVFLVKYDIQKFVQDIHKSTTKNDWILQKTNNEETFEKIAKMVAEYSRYFENEAQKYGGKVFNMDEDFSKQLNTIEKYFNNEA